MTITLSGENSFGWQRELRALSDAFIADNSDLGLERIDGEEASIDQIRESLTGLPFLVNKKLIILRTPSKNKQFAEQAEQLLSEVPETTDVIVIEPKLDKRLSYYKFLKSKTDFREFPELDQHGLANWLVITAKEQGGSLSNVDARYLVERVGANQQLLNNELDKLMLYDKKVTRQAIDLLTEPTPQSTIFQLLEVAFAGQAQRTQELYKEQRALKVEPPQIIAMLAWQLHVLAIIKTAGERSIDGIAKEARLNPFVLRKSQAIARSLSLGQLKTLINDLLSIDARSKRSNLDSDEALQLYLLKLSSNAI